MNTSLVTLEIIKLASQFFGAMVIARLAVRWALTRYKSEKTWERRLSAYADAVTALSEMKLVVGRWFDALIEQRPDNDEYDKVQRDRYQAARRRLDDGIANALLLLPDETARLLTDVSRGLEDARNSNTHEEYLDHQYGVLDKALSLLIEQGRRTLKL